MLTQGVRLAGRSRNPAAAVRAITGPGHVGHLDHALDEEALDGDEHSGPRDAGDHAGEGVAEVVLLEELHDEEVAQLALRPLRLGRRHTSAERYCQPFLSASGRKQTFDCIPG